MLRARGLVLSAALFLALAVAGSAGAISLYDLETGGGTIASGNGELTFSAFDGEVEGLPFWIPEDLFLKGVQVTALDDGFRIYAPFLIAFNSDLKLTVDYDVDAAAGLAVSAVSIQFWGYDDDDGEARARATYTDALNAVVAQLFVDTSDPTEYEALADLHPFLHGESVMKALAEECDSHDSGDYRISTSGGSHHDGGDEHKDKCFAWAKKLDHHFKTEDRPVPAPATSGLVGSGLAGLWLAGRRRTRRD